MRPTIDFALRVINRFYGDAVQVLNIDNSNNCVDVFFKDNKGNIREYFQAPNSKYVIYNI